MEDGLSGGNEPPGESAEGTSGCDATKTHQRGGNQARGRQNTIGRLDDVHF